MNHARPTWRLALAALACTFAATAWAAEWPAARGSRRRPGNLDGLPGPATPKVLWVWRAQEHYLAAPVPGEEVLYLAALGPFNTGVLRALSAAPDAAPRALWSKAAPYVRRPTVCAPALAGGFLVFGDGMHQTDDAILYCLEAASGRPVWQYAVPGKLVHMEGSPTIEQGRVYIGGGAAGVLCLDLKRVTLDGADLDVAAAQALLEKRWAELLAKYEEDRKKDPDFAVPPGDDALPKPSPRLLWQAGKDAWHVDAPVAVAGDRVLAASAYLDEERVGKRALVCLSAADGSVLWEAPLKINPWAGPTVTGGVVFVGCSTIRFDVKRLAGAAGEIVALDLATGQVKWRKDVPGGVLSPVSVSEGLAVFAATDGKVRAWDAAAGQERWAYDAAAPFFGGPALAAGTVYAADLRARVHAIALADGQMKWSLDVGAGPEVLAPGMVYASPTVHGGRVYLATCNVEGDAGRPSAVICLADRSAVAVASAAAAPAVDRARRRVTLPCRVAPRKLPTLKDIYPIEVVCTRPSPEGLKAHETVVTFEARPSQVHQALESLGLKPGAPARGDAGAAAGPEVEVLLEFPGPGGQTCLVPIEDTLLDRRTGRTLPRLAWRFTGSVLRQPDPNRPDKVYGADLSGTLIAVFPVTDETVLQSSLTMKEEMLLKLETNPNILPPEGTPATLILAVKAASEAAGQSGGRASALALAPSVEAPAAAPPDALWPMPPAVAIAPVPIRDRRRPALLAAPSRPFARPVLDLPPVAANDLPAPAPPVLVPSGERVSGPPAAPPSLPSVMTGTRPASRRPSLESDPVQNARDRSGLLASPGMRRGPAPLVAVTVPDPFAVRRAMALHEVPPDVDPPVSVEGLPGKVTLPLAPPPAPAP